MKEFNKFKEKNDANFFWKELNEISSFVSVETRKKKIKKIFIFFFLSLSFLISFLFIFLTILFFLPFNLNYDYGALKIPPYKYSDNNLEKYLKDSQKSLRYEFLNDQSKEYLDTLFASNPRLESLFSFFGYSKKNVSFSFYKKANYKDPLEPEDLNYNNNNLNLYLKLNIKNFSFNLGKLKNLYIKNISYFYNLFFIYKHLFHVNARLPFPASELLKNYYNYYYLPENFFINNKKVKPKNNGSNLKWIIINTSNLYKIINTQLKLFLRNQEQEGIKSLKIKPILTKKPLVVYNNEDNDNIDKVWENFKDIFGENENEYFINNSSKLMVNIQNGLKFYICYTPKDFDTNKIHEITIKDEKKGKEELKKYLLKIQNNSFSIINENFINANNPHKLDILHSFTNFDPKNFKVKLPKPEIELSHRKLEIYEKIYEYLDESFNKNCSSIFNIKDLHLNNFGVKEIKDGDITFYASNRKETISLDNPNFWKISSFTFDLDLKNSTPYEISFKYPWKGWIDLKKI